MKPRRLADLRGLLSHPDFQEWWTALEKARGDLQVSRQRYDELLSQATLMEFRAELTQKNAIDTLYAAGELEDQAANMLVEAQQLENRSMVAVADFEEQRFRASELWYRLGASEKKLEECREADKQRTRRTETDLKAAEKTYRLAADDYEREMGRKGRMWDEVERLWGRSAEVSLLVSEHKVRGRKIRKEAEALFALAEERKARSKALRSEAEHASHSVDAAQKQIEVLLARARERFGCTSGREFLFFRIRDNPKQAWAVSLVEDREHFNLELKPLGLYCVERQRGVAFLEPARAEPPNVEDGDRRFEEYFLQGRRGEVRTLGGSR